MRNLSSALDTRTYTVRLAPVAFNVRANAARRAFWGRLGAGLWEPQTFRVFQRFLQPDEAFIDIGAWIGPTALYAANLAGHVHAVEPDPTAYAELAENIAANPALQKRITLHCQCIAAETGPVNLYAGGMYHSGASHFGDSMSSLVPVSENAFQPRQCVDGVQLMDFIAAQTIGNCGFIKMDVEGGEYSLIPGHWRDLAAYGMPALHVSFHAPAAARREALIGACFAELRSCYAWLYSARGEPLAGGILDDVPDWNDESPGSAWLKLENLLGEGIVASNRPW